MVLSQALTGFVFTLALCFVKAAIECTDDHCAEDPIQSGLLSWYEEWKQGFQVAYITVDDLRDEYDFIVIGAGVGGSVVAHRLAMHDSHPAVLLLEAGSKHQTSGVHPEITPVLVQLNQLTDIDWQFKSEPSDGYCCEWYNNSQLAMPRGKVMGGSGVLNYMMWVRGHRADWDDLMRVDGWTWDDVLPFFKKIESVHAYGGFRSQLDGVRGFDGPVIVNAASELRSRGTVFEDAAIEACEAEGIPYLPFGQNNGDNIGVAYTEFNVDDNGQRNSAFLAYNKYLRGRYKEEYASGEIKLDILPFAHVTKIVFAKDDDDKTPTATGVTFIDGQSTARTVKVSTNGEVVLSAGAYASPHLLKLSGVGPKDELTKFGIDVVVDLPGVGENLSDHVMNMVRYHYAPDYVDEALTANKIGQTLADFDVFKEYLLRGQGTLATSSLGVNGFVQSNYSTASFPDLQLYFVPGWGGVDKFQNLQKEIQQRKKCGDLRYWRDVDNMDNFLVSVGLQHPASVGWVRLQSADPFVLPLVQPNFLKEQIDVDRLKYGLKMVDRIMRQPSMRRLWDERMDCKAYGDMFSDDEAMERYVRDSVHHIYHPTGTCKMGDVDKDHMVVVDNKLQVKGVRNLRVVDASVLPSQTSGNTQVPVFMIAERAAEFILQKRSSP